MLKRKMLLSIVKCSQVIDKNVTTNQQTNLLQIFVINITSFKNWQQIYKYAIIAENKCEWRILNFKINYKQG